ncbi:hypothetical protein NG798_09820 [Ancylothrix sp. C2]|uniref:hypothetical protein n=1 Tax=Ancylothrix sp. D3o TaxID=2953691 RepID=UPI0021BAB77B|nr:hypothetical protein [Ancylothrix sp. D3o]MCT7950082.1 hypothetical protein [Ancylothrix sp. D3o]
MNSAKNGKMDVIISDLEMLIAEIEKNPQLSRWVMRMTIKAIQDKAEKIAIETAQQAAHQKQLALRN